MARSDMTAGVLTALDGDINLAFIIRLDIATDPVFAWTGFGDLTFSSGQTGDSALDGFTFQGITHVVAEIGAVTDETNGSQALVLSLPGVDLTDELLRQVVFNRNQWQFRQAWMWVMLVDSAGNLIGKPLRVKTGRMDSMDVAEADDGSGTVATTVESAQAYASEALCTRYSEQKELDASDTSQNYVWALANMSPTIGAQQAAPVVWSTGSIGDPSSWVNATIS